ncbi:MAG: protein phosphatase 2C domain-containing protein [Chthoniobacteraceae bacterium]
MRKNNEDAFLCLQFDAQEVRYLGKIGEDAYGHSDFVFAVSDGMGGAKAGEFASRIAVDKITYLLPRAFKQTAGGLNAGFADVLGELFDQIHGEMMQMGRNYPECAGMGATLSMCIFTPGQMFFAHIGDSRIYYLPAREGGLKQLTADDTHVGWLFRNRKINEREARNHPRRNLLQKALGGGHQFVDPQVGSVLYDAGDRFLLCTDGLVEGLYDEQLLELLRTPDPAAAAQTPAQRLVAASVERAGRDNTTAVVVEVV